MNSFLKKEAFPLLGSHLMRSLASTLRWKLDDPHHVFSPNLRTPMLFACWHNRLLLLPFIYERYLSPYPIRSLISQSRDGEWITAIVEHFGMQAVRGSSSKKGSHAFRELIHDVQQNQTHVGITPDGPRGPRYQPHPGIFHLSYLTQRPIVPLTIHYESYWELQSWDRFQIPYPGTRAHILIAQPRVIEKPLTDSILADEIQWIKKSLGN